MSEIIWYLFSLNSLFHLVLFSPGLSVLSQRVKLSSFLGPSSGPLYKCPMVVLSSYLSMDTWVASKSWQL